MLNSVPFSWRKGSCFIYILKIYLVLPRRRWIIYREHGENYTDGHLTVSYKHRFGARVNHLLIYSLVDIYTQTSPWKFLFGEKGLGKVRKKILTQSRQNSNTTSQMYTFEELIIVVYFAVTSGSFLNWL